MYCAHCGNPLSEPEIKAEEHVEETALAVSADVSIAQINAERDIKLAKIAAGIAESEAVVEMAHAEGIAEGMETATAPAEAAPAEPVVIMDAPADVDQEPSPLDVPPAAGSEHHDEKPKRSGYGSKSWFG